MMDLWVKTMMICTSIGGLVFYLRLGQKSKTPLWLTLSIILALNMFMLSACTKAEKKPSRKTGRESIESEIVTDAEAETPTKALSSQDRALAFIDPTIDEALALIEGDRQEGSQVTYNYAPQLLYDDLTPEDKVFYDEMLAKAQALEAFTFTADQDGYPIMDKAMWIHGLIMEDHPSIENYFYMKELVEGDTTTGVEALYFMPGASEILPADPIVLSQEIAYFEAVCDRIVDRMPENFSTYDRYRYLAAVISLVTTYDYDIPEGWQVGTAYGALVGGHSICQGYSRGFLYLCQKANLWCQTVGGVAGGNTSHAWNMVKLESGTYHVDITWSDERGLPDRPEWKDYFMLTQDQILVDHEITDGKLATGTPIH